MTVLTQIVVVFNTHHDYSYSIISGKTFCSSFLLDLGLVTNSRF